MKNRGLLLTMTEPPAGMEEEFNAWYDTEHIAERLGIAGFRSAKRWVADVRPGGGKYIATYELDALDVLESHEYLARFQAATPWTRRCLEKCLVFKRWACEQTAPGSAEPRSDARALLFIASDGPIADLALPGALQTRRFAASAGNPRHIALVEFAAMQRPPKARPEWQMQMYRAYGT